MPVCLATYSGAVSLKGLSICAVTKYVHLLAHTAGKMAALGVI